MVVSATRVDVELDGAIEEVVVTSTVVEATLESGNVVRAVEGVVITVEDPAPVFVEVAVAVTTVV